MKLQPLADRVVVKPLTAEEKTKGGIILPDTAKEKPQEGEIVAVGKGKILDNGELQKLEVKIGDRVLYGKYSGTQVELDNEEIILIKESDVIAKLA